MNIVVHSRGYWLTYITVTIDPHHRERGCCQLFCQRQDCWQNAQSNCLHNEGMGDPRYEHITIMPNGILLDTPEFFSPTDSITNYCYISMSNYIQSILRFYKRQSLTIPSIYNMRAASFSSLIGILRINERITF